MGLGNTTFQCAQYRRRLLVYFLHHKVLVLAFIARFMGQVADHGFALDALVVEIKDLHRTAGHFGNIALFQIDKVLCHR